MAGRVQILRIYTNRMKYEIRVIPVIESKRYLGKYL